MTCARWAVWRVALNERIFVGKPTGRSSERTAMAVVAQLKTTTLIAGFGRL